MSIDYWKLTKDFQPGDYVQQVVLGQGLTPYMGRVLAAMPGIGFLDIQWPFGTERISPEWLVKVNPKLSPYLPPSLNFSYLPGQDARMASSSSPWRSIEVPQGFHKELARIYSRGTAEVKAYDELWHRFASFADDEAIRDEVMKFYRFASNSLDMVMSEAIQKTATYWAAQNRQHRATKAEVDAKRPNCPRCGSRMRKAVYKMEKGIKARLFACPKDLYLIKRDNIMGPEGEPVEW